jgi:hypothetical protein
MRRRDGPARQAQQPVAVDQQRADLLAGQGEAIVAAAPISAMATNTEVT